MLKCPECSGEISEARASCPSCGAPLDSSLLPTRVRSDEPARGTGEARAGAGGSLGASRAKPSHDSIDDARFAPGHVLGGRYRIVGLLGRGGMGEVYRADDLALKQPVALKLLPEALSTDGEALERFRREVRVARQISHPNVCRVYDIGEAEGLHFLSMEFIRGEELASVLKRFGRLPFDKAAEIARQICAGVAAAHKAGVVHRDLKPANVMIDEAGEARVTDFGLAAIAEEVRGDERAGTPAYMSPEQLAGRELTARSDIYSLGLVLYELFTGRRAFEASTLAELLRLRETGAQPSSPASHVKDLDPLVERVIRRCLDRDPERRPASALEVAAALPGGDPLAAALALGETPSPEMVAAAPKQGILRPAVAFACLAGVLLGLVLTALLTERTTMYRVAPIEKPPEVLRERAREIIARLGYRDRPLDSADGLTYDGAYLNYVQEHDRSASRWQSLKSGRTPVFYYWYRESPRYLAVVNMDYLKADDPPWTVSGMAGVRLDMSGRLHSFRAVAPQLEEVGGEPGAPDWTAAFAEAKLNLAEFRPVAPRRTPPDYADERAAWEGTWPDEPSLPVRVEAASFRGRPIFFEVVFPWDGPARQGEVQPGGQFGIIDTVATVLILVLIISGPLLAWRNLRLGRGDRKGAFRLALISLFLIMAAWWVLVGHHVPQLVPEFNNGVTHLGWALYYGVLVWVLYVAIEPFVRARWPHRIISWTRLLAGDWRDPLVGRDLLLGSLVGVGYNVLDCLWTLAPGWLGRPPDAPFLVLLWEGLFALLGLRGYLFVYLDFVWWFAIAYPLSLLFGLLLLLILLRREWLSAVAGWALLTYTLGLAGGGNLGIDLFFAGLLAALCVFCVMRLGLLASSAFFLMASGLYLPLAADFSVWYAPYAVLSLLLLAAPAIYGCYTSLGGQPLFSGSLLDRTESGR
ncbi:MAG TPA: serine/threonine-protein kinase [Pyrinomonadaceae bacterium]|nr:serine/threonine-protein kinase [Pyrinomonadaceae bacterium]